MSISKNVGLRIPNELLEEIDARIGADGRNRSEVILALVKRGLVGSDASAILERLNAIEDKLPDWTRLIDV